MQYMLLIYSTEDPSAEPSVEQFEAGMNAHRALMEETRQRGALVSAQPLKPSPTAKTVRLSSDMKPIIIDGPFTETKEQLAGYYLVDCSDLEEAISYAKKIPMMCAAGKVRAVEVRPILELSEVQERYEALVAGNHA